MNRNISRTHTRDPTSDTQPTSRRPRRWPRASRSAAAARASSSAGVPWQARQPPPHDFMPNGTISGRSQRLAATDLGRRGRRMASGRSRGHGRKERQPRHRSAPWPLGRTTAIPSRCRPAARFRLGGPPHGPQRAVQVQRPGLRLRHHAVEIPACRGPEMRRVLGRHHGQSDRRLLAPHGQAGLSP